MSDQGAWLRRPDLLREAAYIGGAWETAATSIAVTNPADGSPVGTIPSLGTYDVLRAVDAARDALPAWRGLSAAERAAILYNWHRLVSENAEDLAVLMTTEQGKPLREARAEVASAAAFLRWFAEEARRIYGQIIPGHAADKRLSVTREPIGVVAAITPWNFPLAMIARKVGPALAAGCTAIVKPSELTPFSATAFARLGEEAGVPAGVLNVVTGHPEEIGEVLLDHPDVAKLSFTGSTRVGKMLAARAMGTVKRVSLELGGNAPFLVFADADIDAAVEGAIASKYRNAGQTCVCANRFLVHHSVAEQFASALARKASALRVGKGMDEATDIGPLINEQAVRKVHQHLEDALAGGGELIAGEAGMPEGNFFPPVVVDKVSPEALLCREETFGPLAGIVRFADEREAIALANATRSGLAAYVYTRDVSASYRITEGLQYGMVGLNTGMVSTEVAPFGGIKESGLGREGSSYGIEEYTNLKLVCTQVETV